MTNLKIFIIQTISTPVLLVLFVLAFGLHSCDGNEEANFSASFNYEFIDSNHVKFTSTSTGEFYSLNWDFGNETTKTTTNRNQVYEIYYHAAGDYLVSLEVLNYTGEKQKVTETISITETDLEVSFTATIDPENPNEVFLENTSVGTFDRFTWYYRDKIVENENTIAYFPKAGQFEIELEVVKGTNVYSEKQNIVIAADDPNYIENMTLVWSDEFDGITVNSTNWTFETGSGGWGNQELQNYTSGENAKVIDGKLIITAKKLDDNKVAGSYTSARMVTKAKKEFKYGRIEIRAKLPSGTGIWPAIWMLGSNISTVGWPACGEIDIMEYVGYEPNTVHATVHTTSGSGGNGDGSSKTLTTCEEEFHIYGLLWDENQLVFYTDTPENTTHIYAPTTKNSESWPFDNKQFFILNIAVGGTWGGAQGIDNSIFPQTMEVDYVRVYQETNN